MKKIFKFFPAALAVVALASCSDIDAPEQNGAYATSEKGDLIVEVEPFDNFTGTRALRDADGGSLTFLNGDLINVYDEELYKYDVYKFNNDAFYLDGDKILTEMKYGLFPGKDVVRGYFDRATKTTVAEFAIPHVIKYDENSEQKIGNKVLYASDLPMFGVATANGSKVNIKPIRHIVSVLQLSLENVKDNVTALRLSANKPLSGTFVAELDASTEEARKAVALKKGKDDLITFNEIYIDLRNVPNRKAVLYIPIIPGYEANKVNLKLDYTSQYGEPELIGDATTPGDPSTGYVESGCKFPKEAFGVHQLKTASWKFELTDMTPNKITALIDQYKNSDETISFELADVFTISSTTAAGNYIFIPKLKKDVNVEMTLGPDFGSTATTTGWINASPDDLYLVDADASKPFDGTIKIDVRDYFSGSKPGVKAETPIVINLPKATVQLVGLMGESSAFTKSLDVQNCKKLIIGDDTNAPAEGASYNTTTFDNSTKFDLAEVGELEIAKYTLFKGNIAQEGSTPSKTAVDIVVTVNGKVQGNIDFSSIFGSELYIKSDFSFMADADADKKVAVSGNVTFGGDVEIALGSEGEAVAGTLKMTGARSDIDLIQGYVKEITVDVANNGEWEDYKFVNLNLNNEKEGRAAFLKLTETAITAAGGGYFKITPSKWDGNAISNVTFSNSYFDKFVTFTELDRETQALKPADATTIFTASQMASFNSIGSACKLSNDLILSNKPWTGGSISKNFDGQKHTVSQLALKGGSGFFKTSAGTGLWITDLTIDGVSVVADATGDNVGSLVGTNNSTTNLNVKNVEIKNISIDNGGAKLLSNIGGVVGNNAKKLNLVGVSVAGTIKGYSALGGFAGLNPGTLVADKDCKLAINIENNAKKGKDMDMACASIGGYVGNNKGGTLTIPALTTAATINLTHAFAAYEYMSDETELAGDFFTFEGKQNYVGFSGIKNQAGTITIATKTYAPAKVGDSTKRGTDDKAWGDVLPLYNLNAK